MRLEYVVVEVRTDPSEPSAYSPDRMVWRRLVASAGVKGMMCPIVLFSWGGRRFNDCRKGSIEGASVDGGGRRGAKGVRR